MVAHVVIAHKRRYFLEETLAQEDVVAHKGINGMYWLERVVCVMLVQVFYLYVPAVCVVVRPGVIHHH